MKEVKQYVALVDSHRKNGIVYCPNNERAYQRQTRGRYRIAAKSEKEAEKLLRAAIGFGSIHIYYEDKNPKTILPYKTVKKETFVHPIEGKLKVILTDPTHATAPCRKEV